MTLVAVSASFASELYANPKTKIETAQFELASAVALAKQRLASLEGVESLAPLEQAISKYELVVFRDAIELAEPWMLLGDAYMQAGSPQAAATAYEQSIHITRVNLGLFTPEQLESVHRQAALLNAMGDIEGATDREEYALVLQRRKFGQQSDLLPALHRMADWYITVSKPAEARYIYDEAIHILKGNPQAQPDLLVHAYLGLAASYLMERFPPRGFYQNDDSEFAWQAPDSRLSRWNLSQGMFFGPANRALLSAETLLRAQDSDSKDTKEKLTEVLVRLGDLNILFEKWSTANSWYRAAFELWSASTDPDNPSNGVDVPALEKWFEEPAPLHLPLPTEIGRIENYPPERIDLGHITLAFSLSSHGKVGQVETLEMHPKRFRDLRFRRVLRESRYRPLVQEGRAVRAERVVHRHEFLYVLDEDVEAPTSSNALNDEP